MIDADTCFAVTCLLMTKCIFVDKLITWPEAGNLWLR